MFPNNSPMLGMSGMQGQQGSQPGGVSPFNANFQTQQQFADPNQWMTNMQAQMAAGQQASGANTPLTNQVTSAVPVSPTPQGIPSFSLPTAAATPAPAQAAAASGAAPSPGQAVNNSQSALISSIMAALGQQTAAGNASNAATSAPASGGGLMGVLGQLGLTGA